MDALERSAIAWEERKPVLGRLPYKGYQENPVAASLTSWVDDFLSDRRLQLETWYQQLDPDVCDITSLDYLAYLTGFSEDLWDLSWAPEVKRALIKLSLSYLWSHRGTLAAINKVLDVHGISRRFWQQQELTLPFSLPGTIGGQGLRLYARLPLQYQRLSAPWLETQRTLRNYAPACVDTKVSFEYFYLGFSNLSDPLYNGDSTAYSVLPGSAQVPYGTSPGLGVLTAPSGTLIYGLQPSGSPIGSAAIVGSTIQYTAVANWGTQEEDRFTYWAWNRQASPVQRTLRVRLQPALRLLYLTTSATPEVHRGFSGWSVTGLTVVSGELRGSGGWQVNTTLADCTVEAQVRMISGDPNHVFDIHHRVSGSTYYLFRFTNTASTVFYWNGSAFSVHASASYAPLVSTPEIRVCRVNLQGANFAMSVAGSPVLTGGGLLNLTTSRLGLFGNATVPTDSRFGVVRVTV